MAIMQESVTLNKTCKRKLPPGFMPPAVDTPPELNLTRRKGQQQSPELIVSEVHEDIILSLRFLNAYFYRPHLICISGESVRGSLRYCSTKSSAHCWISSSRSKLVDETGICLGGYYCIVCNGCYLLVFP